MLERTICNKFWSANLCWAFTLIIAAGVGVVVWVAPMWFGTVQAQSLANQSADIQIKSTAASLDQHIAEERVKTEKIFDTLTTIQGDIRVLRDRSERNESFQ